MARSSVGGAPELTVDAENAQIARVRDEAKGARESAGAEGRRARSEPA